ncbi:bacteriohemerythrin [Campylobacter cuniculorum]|uniref:Hemerythrin-like metal-binding domain protein n=2 Tax=Campylobacter cuniculorum TaxID=374106 RepID=A0A1W6BXS3_9BACT|nr:bacteriohemerythrin [Campylobacter cuniculorum]ARJ56881.1 hemerythrin-like metal-binding domain protein [Campylobacter cuniculorum DSM 23162 = LMG 24588]QOR04343.1 bacteriohemerythrin [Campylobacter cuniculorum]
MLPLWENSYSIFNARVDEQHKKLFDLCAKVEMISDKPVSKNEIKELLTEFFNYMKYHFSDEEKYMQLIGYPELESHRKIHKEIVRSMIDLIKDIKTTNDLKEKLYNIAKKWLSEHILYEDMKIAQWRRSALASDDGSEISFEEEDLNDDEKPITYLYVCDCAGKMHDVPYGIHQKITLKNAKFVCKVCKQPIKFYKEYT